MLTEATPPIKERLAAWARETRRAKARAAALDSANTVRLKAQSEFRRNSAIAVREAMPRNIDHLVEVLWPLVALYAETVFDAIAESQLRTLGARFLTRRYLHWLECTCVPAVVELFHTVRLYDYAKHIRDVIGESQWPAGIDETRRALARLMTEFLGGPHAENLENRIGVVLNARISHWEAVAIEKQAEVQAPRVTIDAPSDKAEKYGIPKLDFGRISEWMNYENYDNELLAAALKISPRAVSSLRNGGKNHGRKALKKLANLMKCDVEDLYLP